MTALDRPASPAGTFSAFGITHRGKVRGHNEDAFGIDVEFGIVVVADGMGGLARGDEASRIVVESVLSAVRAGGDIDEGLRVAHDRIREPALAGDAGPSGATAVVVAVGAGAAGLAWVGDSRAYRCRDARLERLTRDHTFVQDLIDLGAITAEEARTHPNRNVVTRAIGVRRTAELEVARSRCELQPGDRLMLCTDGLYGYLRDERICEILGAGGSDEELARRLQDATLDESEAGDNVTVVVLTFPG